ncbi:hypothetical protein [uncultured Ruminobacter sp.]|uniref:hypothetical protein n=1 Tax=uncultured Ruminobacter sp. TaxID=538947 RepID=UPI0025E7BE54|nr:hypothetical protein [uncultured Ruminobacter sp.]
MKIDLTAKISTLIRRLADMKKDHVFTDSTYKLHVLQNDTVEGIHTVNTPRPDESVPFDGEVMIGVFPMKGEAVTVALADILIADGQTLGSIVPDGMYENLAGGSVTEICLGRMYTTGKALIIRSGSKCDR